MDNQNQPRDTFATDSVPVPPESAGDTLQPADQGVPEEAASPSPLAPPSAAPNVPPGDVDETNEEPGLPQPSSRKQIRQDYKTQMRSMKDEYKSQRKNARQEYKQALRFAPVEAPGKSGRGKGKGKKK